MGRAVVTNSCTPTQAATATSTNSHQPPSQSMPSTSGRPTAATSKRDARLLTSRSPAREGGGSSWGKIPHGSEPKASDSSPAESTAPARVFLDRGPELLRPEVGPERVGEDVLGIGGLPEEEVRDAPLARGPDHEVGIRHLRLVEARGERRLVDLARIGTALEQPTGGVDELRAAAVVES